MAATPTLSIRTARTRRRRAIAALSFAATKTRSAGLTIVSNGDVFRKVGQTERKRALE